jgi:hypothetical protein
MKWFKRPPDEIIGDSYLRRWHVIPRNRFFNIYLHHFVGNDPGRALHDHPWHNATVVLKGGYAEEQYDEDGEIFRGRLYSRGWIVLRSAGFAHRIVKVKPNTWTLFFTGPWKRDWGFYEGDHWIHWREYTKSEG